MSEDFYQSHLDRVSRSFAFCIQQLPEPLKEWVSVSYLLCRTLDTVEDAAWADMETQLGAFRAFDEALNGAKGLPTDWSTTFPSSIPQNERKLLEDVDQLFSGFRGLPAPVQRIIRDLVGMMSGGMQHFARLRADDGLRLSTLQEVNQYCFFVAGVVGEMLAKLLAIVEPRFQVSEQSLVRAHHFGLFLQKVNLLKDHVGDEKEGRHLIPNRELVEKSAAENADAALAFLQAIPVEQMEFRRFCAWSLFLGLEALQVARRSVQENRVLKVSRERLAQLVEEIEAELASAAGLRSLFLKCVQPLGWGSNPVSADTARPVPQWLLGLYSGPLGVEQLNQLGVTT